MKTSNPFFATSVNSTFDESTANRTFPTAKKSTQAQSVNPWLNSLLCYWKADDSAIDSSVNGLHLNLVDAFMPPPTAYATGILGNAFDFDGTTGYALGREVADDVFNFTGDFAISLWVQFDDVAPPSNNSLLSNFDLGFGYPGWSGWALFADNNATGILLRTGITQIGIYSTTLSIATWYHIVVSRSGENFTIYLNGSGSEIGTYSGAFSASTQPLYVGMGPNGGFAVNGRMDEIAMWSRALTPTEAADLYNGGTGMPLI